MFSSLAFAKVNLLLKVTGRRNDGYHLLDSLVGFCEFGDRLEISLNEARDEIITEGTFGREIGENNIIKNITTRHFGMKLSIDNLTQKELNIKNF